MALKSIQVESATDEGRLAPWRQRLVQLQGLPDDGASITSAVRVTILGVVSAKRHELRPTTKFAGCQDSVRSMILPTEMLTS